MTKWEYLIVDLRFEGSSELDDLQKFFDQMGEQGWELVWIHTSPPKANLSVPAALSALGGTIQLSWQDHGTSDEYPIAYFKRARDPELP